MLRAGMGLADMALADGRLRGPRDWWTHRQLADAMHLSPNTARDVLLWLGETDWLTKQAQTITPEGRLPDARWLTIPIAQESITTLSNGSGIPVLKNGGPSAQKEQGHGSKSGSPLLNVRIPALDNTLDNLSYLDTQGAVSRTPKQIFEEARDRKRAESVA
jgi:hypothetical protein